MARAVQDGWLEEQINAARYRNQRDLDSGRKALVGVNRYAIPEEQERPIEVHKIKADEWGARRSQYLAEFRSKRDKQKWGDSLNRIESAWKAGENMVPVIMNALRNSATMGEIHEAMRNAQNWSFR